MYGFHAPFGPGEPAGMEQVLSLQTYWGDSDEFPYGVNTPPIGDVTYACDTNGCVTAGCITVSCNTTGCTYKPTPVSPDDDV
jgi:hypothetical protein